MTDHRHEKSDMKVSAFLLVAFLTSLVLIIAHFALNATFGHLRARENRPTTEAQQASERLPPPVPRLQNHPRQDYQTYLRDQQAILNSYGWTNEKEKIARIPIQRAMQLLASQKKRKPSSLEGIAQPSVRFDQHLGAHLPTELFYRSEFDEQVELGKLMQGKPLILVFAYYRCPHLCTLVLNGLIDSIRKLPDQLGRDYQIVTLSIDPTETSSLAMMKRRTYLSKLGNPDELGWHFLTGEESAIRKLASSAGFVYERDAVSHEYSHPSGFLVVTPQGKISRYFFGIRFDAHELHQALSDAAQEHQGGWVKEILLYCLHYDPRTSRSGAVVMSVLRISGVLAVFSIICGLYWLSRRKAVA